MTIRQFFNQLKEYSKGIKELKFWNLFQPD